MSAAPTGETRDPQELWDVFRNVFKNLLSAPAQQDTYITSISSLVKAFPQTLVATAAWPQQAVVAGRRQAFLLALLRQLIQCMASGRTWSSPSPEEVVAQVLLLIVSLSNILLEVLHLLLQHHPPSWKTSLRSLLELWHRLAETANLLAGVDSQEVEGLTESDLGVAVRLLPAPAPEDTTFPPDTNFLVLACPDKTEGLQEGLTRLLGPLPPVMLRYAPSLLPRYYLLQYKTMESR